MKSSNQSIKTNTMITFQDELTHNVFCASTRHLENHECLPFVEKMQNVRLILNIRVLPKDSFNISVYWQIADKIQMEITRSARQLGCVTDLVTEVVHTKDIFQSALYQIVIYFDYLVIDVAYTNVYAFYSDLTFRVVASDLNTYEFTTSIEDRLDFREYFKVFSITVEHVDPTMATDVDNLGSPAPVIGTDVTTVVVRPPPDTLQFCFFFEPAPFINFMHLIKCPLINVSQHDHHWTILPDKSIRIGNTYILKTKDFYYTSAESIAVCKSSFDAYVKSIHSSPDRFSSETIVSIVCIGCSLLCLVLSVITYTILPKLRQSLPGKNTFALICFLLLAQTLYLVGSLGGLTSNEFPCRFLGLITHFSWLCAMFWMNICTFHMFRVLTRTKVASALARWKRFLLYNVYSLTLSLVFVATNIGVSKTRNGSIGYGSLACYIDTQDMIIFTFALPVGLVVVMNLLFFVVVIVKISRSPSVQKSVKNERNDFEIFVKLSTITGITWVFGLIYMFTDVVAFSYLFIVVNASQGVFLFFAFVANRRVTAMLRERLCGRPQGVESRTSTRSTVVSMDYIKS